MNVFYLSLLAYVSANPLVDGVIPQAASMVGEFHASGVPAASASKSADALISSYVHAAPIDSFIEKLVHKVEMEMIPFGDMPKFEPSMAIEIMNGYKGAFSAFHAAPEFANFKKAVEAALPLYDTKKMIAQGQSLIKAVNSKTAIKSLYSSFTAAPEGKVALSSAQELYDLHNQVFNLHLPAFSMWLNLL